MGFEKYHEEKKFGGLAHTMPKSIEWLSEHKDEKLFLFLQGYDVHGRFPFKEEHLQKFLGEKYRGSLKGTEDEYWDLRNENIEKGQITINEEDMRFLRSVYDAKIFSADQRLGYFIKSLQQTGLLEKSIIIISEFLDIRFQWIYLGY